MAVSNWPAGVPYKPLIGGLSANQSYKSPILSETEGGPPIMRGRPGPRVTEMQFQSTLWTKSQWEEFENFARETLIDGTLIFTMPVIRPNNCFVTRYVQIKDGNWQTDFSVNKRFKVSFILLIYNW